MVDFGSAIQSGVFTIEQHASFIQAVKAGAAQTIKASRR
jgi:hypothetical protein